PRDRRGRGRRRLAARSLEHGKLLRRGGDEAARRVIERLRGRRVRVGEHERAALVGTLAQLLLKRHLAEQGNVELIGQQLAAALAELADRLVEHRPAPDARLVLTFEEELDRDRLYAARSDKRDELALGGQARAAVDAEHARDRVAPDVGVERGGRVALGGQSG